MDGIEKPIVGHPRMAPGERVRYVANNRSFGAFIRSDQMRDVTVKVARAAARAATAAAPPPSANTLADDPEASAATYEVVERPSRAFIKVAGNIRVKVEIVGKGRDAERAEFGHSSGDVRFRNLARTGSRFGDWHPLD